MNTIFNNENEETLFPDEIKPEEDRVEVNEESFDTKFENVGKDLAEHPGPDLLGKDNETIRRKHYEKSNYKCRSENIVKL